MSESLFQWDLPSPVLVDIAVQPEDIDHYGHVNNAVYLTWLETCAWAYSEQFGVTVEKCQAMDVGMAVVHTSLDYLGACYAGETVRVATWIVDNDNRLRCKRRYQIIRHQDKRTVMRAETVFACLQLSTGKPRRMPDLFKKAYGVLPEIATALATSRIKENR